MRKGLILVFSLLVVFSLGAVFLHCGDDDGGCPGGAVCCEKQPECDTGLRCDLVEGTCGDCCADAPAGEIHMWISGKVFDMTDPTKSGVAAALAPISPMDALTNPDPDHLTEVQTGADGLFKTDCFNVTAVALGVVMLTDDVGFDGTGGSYFPSATGVRAWDKNAEKYCEENAPILAVPNTIVGALDAYTNVDSATYGFVMGIVVDADYNPIEGATVELGDGTALTEVIYPAADFSAFDGTATAVTGLYVLPHTNFALGIIDITAKKDGMTFKTTKAAPKAGFCYLAFIEAK